MGKVTGFLEIDRVEKAFNQLKKELRALMSLLKS